MRMGGWRSWGCAIMSGDRRDWARPMVMQAISTRLDAPKVVISPTAWMILRFPRPCPPAGRSATIDLMQRARDRETYGGACD